MNRKNQIKIVLLYVATVLTTVSCTTVKPYQKMYLNDREMELAQRKLVVFESNFESYREAAAGANGGKVGGGCGCN